MGGGGGGGDELKVILNNILIKKFVWKRRNGMQHDGLSRIGLSIMSPLQARHKRGRCLLSMYIYLGHEQKRAGGDRKPPRFFARFVEREGRSASYRDTRENRRG